MYRNWKATKQLNMQQTTLLTILYDFLLEQDTNGFKLNGPGTKCHTLNRVKTYQRILQHNTANMGNDSDYSSRMQNVKRKTVFSTLLK